MLKVYCNYCGKSFKLQVNKPRHKRIFCSIEHRQILINKINTLTLDRVEYQKQYNLKHREKKHRYYLKHKNDRQNNNKN